MTMELLKFSRLRMTRIILIVCSKFIVVHFRFITFLPHSWDFNLTRTEFQHFFFLTKILPGRFFIRSFYTGVCMPSGCSEDLA